MRIQFNPETHTYSDERGVIPSVTQIIKAAGLMGDWCKADEYAMLRGTYVHKACAAHLRGTLIEESVDDEIMPYLNAFRKFLADTKFKYDSCEKLVYHGMFRYAGTYDLFGRSGKRLWLIDIKSGAMPKWAAIQTMGYLMAMKLEFPMKIMAVTTRHGLELRPDGTYSFTSFDDDVRDARVFGAALNIANWKKEKGIQ